MLIYTYVSLVIALGCPTPAPPADGYLSYRNATHAEFLCCVHHAFPDTMTRRRILQCSDRTQTWNDTLPDCVGAYTYNNPSAVVINESHCLYSANTVCHQLFYLMVMYFLVVVLK